MARPTWLVALIRAGFPGRFVLAGVTRWPVVGKALEKWLFDGDDLVFLPSDRVVQVGRDVDALRRVIRPAQLLIHAQQVLQLENTPHGGRSKMLEDDGFVDSRLAV